jgi:CHAT domain-containing protein
MAYKYLCLLALLCPALLQAQETPTVASLLDEAEAYRSAGYYAEAEARIAEAVNLADQQKVSALQAQTRYSLGMVQLARHQRMPAQETIAEGLRHAAENSLERARLLHLQGNLAYLDERYADALSSYRDSAALAQSNGDRLLWLQTVNNQARVHLKQKQFDEAESLLATALQAAATLPDNIANVFESLAVGQLYLRLPAARLQPHLNTLHTLFSEVAAASEKEPRLRATVYAYQASLYEQAGQRQDAMRLVQTAIFLSQEHPDLLYRWEWQRGRLLQAGGDIGGALTAYRRALHFLKKIRSGLLTGQQDSKDAFYERIRPIYYDLADVLLQRATQEKSVEEQQKLREETLNVLEELKAVELQDYFQDDCVAALREKSQDLSTLQQKLERTAALYPVLLEKRTELLLLTQDSIQQITVPDLSLETIKEVVYRFRKNLETDDVYEFMGDAWQLYQWLIAPLEDTLQNRHIRTLVWVPDSVLRLIPPVALHDGKDFLLKRFAFVTTPGMTLLEPKPITEVQHKLFANGLSESREGLPALPSVPQELEEIRSHYADSIVLLNDAFTPDKVHDTLKNDVYSLLHIASHGEFARDPERSFILTASGKLKLKDLGDMLGVAMFREQPVELLGLSACKTAAGDERTALGLAGIAVKSGARSALASLWSAHDATTAKLMGEFYKQLPLQNSKSLALQAAQIEIYNALLAQGEELPHPFYWASFILIGNWL